MEHVPPQAPIQTEPSSIPTAHQVEPESNWDQEESATSIGAFSGFLTGIATAVEQRVCSGECVCAVLEVVVVVVYICV